MHSIMIHRNIVHIIILILVYRTLVMLDILSVATMDSAIKPSDQIVVLQVVVVMCFVQRLDVFNEWQLHIIECI